MVDTVRQYGLDGVDLDDEYAGYGSNGIPNTNDQSIGWFIEALRSDLGPDGVISFYDYGPAASSIASDPASIGSQITFSSNPYYDSFNVPQVPGLGAGSLAPAAIDFLTTSQADAASLATQTKNGGYGLYMTYALTGGDHSAYISAFTNVLYGSPATYN